MCIGGYQAKCAVIPSSSERMRRDYFYIYVRTARADRVLFETVQWVVHDTGMQNRNPEAVSGTNLCTLGAAWVLARVTETTLLSTPNVSMIKWKVLKRGCSSCLN